MFTKWRREYRDWWWSWLSESLWCWCAIHSGIFVEEMAIDCA